MSALFQEVAQTVSDTILSCVSCCSKIMAQSPLLMLASSLYTIATEQQSSRAADSFKGTGFVTKCLPLVAIMTRNITFCFKTPNE
jgi:hypothetical protein